MTIRTALALSTALALTAVGIVAGTSCGWLGGECGICSCRADSDCGAGEICDRRTILCVGPECTAAAECQARAAAGVDVRAGTLCGTDNDCAADAACVVEGAEDSQFCVAAVTDAATCAGERSAAGKALVAVHATDVSGGAVTFCADRDVGCTAGRCTGGSFGAGH